MLEDIKKVGINIPIELLAKIDAYAAKLHINRTAAICVLCTNSLQAAEGMNSILELNKLMQDFTEKLPKTINE